MVVRWLVWSCDDWHGRAMAGMVVRWLAWSCATQYYLLIAMGLDCNGPESTQHSVQVGIPTAQKCGPASRSGFAFWLCASGLAVVN